MTLVDTCVWIGHAKRTDPVLVGLLSTENAMLHPFVLGELVAGTLRGRETTISLLESMPTAQIALEGEVRHLVETHRLWGLGLGWVDLHLVASALISRVNLLTDDRRLATVARRLGIGYPVQ